MLDNFYFELFDYMVIMIWTVDINYVVFWPTIIKAVRGTLTSSCHHNDHHLYQSHHQLILLMCSLFRYSPCCTNTISASYCLLQWLGRRKPYWPRTVSSHGGAAKMNLRIWRGKEVKQGEFSISEEKKSDLLGKFDETRLSWDESDISHQCSGESQLLSELIDLKICLLHFWS